MPNPKTELSKLAAYFLRDGLVNAETAEQISVAIQHQTISLTNYLVKSKILTSQTILEYCVKQFRLPVFDLKKYDITHLCDIKINPELIYRYRMLPLYRDEHTLYLGMSDPTDHKGMNVFCFQTGLSISPLLVDEEELDRLITTHCNPAILDSKLESSLLKLPEEHPLIESQQEEEEPIIQFVNWLLQEANDKKISDIHIEPYEHYCRIRFRRDGLLYEAATIPPQLTNRIVTRLKIMANLDIAERRLPQDGRIQMRKSWIMDIRINTCPTLFGEKIVLRILNNLPVNLEINSLGFTTEQEQLFLKKLSEPQGLILVTGPTGSGKTITLYAALSYLNQVEKNIVSVEDPVEIELAGINQININPRINLDYATVLRAILRQDPEIIMLGEIRDQETALTAIQAAHTGHLVLSTLHTNNSLETITRLRSMGIDTHYLISSISLIIAQRLLRKLCNDCKQSELLPKAFCDTHRLSIQSGYRSVGCKKCHQGYQGRIGIFELLSLHENNLAPILSIQNTHELIMELKQSGWKTLLESGIEKVLMGMTSLMELRRVLGNQLL